MPCKFGKQNLLGIETDIPGARNPYINFKIKNKNKLWL